MISNIWTLQAASGGPEKTLSAWGFTSINGPVSINQGVSTVSLGLSVDDALTMEDLWEWETELILRRDGAIYWRGYLDTTPRSLSPRSEVASYELKNHWWLLERLDYRQNWTALLGTGALGPVRTGRVALGRDVEVPLAGPMFDELAAFCATMGVTLEIDYSDLPDEVLPVIEGHNRTVAELIREILKWFPGVTLVPVYGADGTSYYVMPASTAPVTEISIGSRPLSDLARIRSLPEIQVDAVQIIYETTAPYSEYEESGEETIGGFLASNALVAATDTFPIGATITRKSLPITLPHPQLPQPPIPQTTYQPVTAKVYPEDGAVDEAAERWWLDKSGLAALGLTDAAILLTTGTTGEKAHRVTRDPSEPTESAPSPINPSSTPIWRPDTVEDVPRELIEGALSDWMNVKAVKLIAEATIGISTTAVNALTPENRADFLRKNPRRGKIGATDVWMLDAKYSFIGTDAVTKVYQRTLAIDYGNVTDSTTALTASQASYTAAVSSAVVPGLAERLYNELSPLHYAGSLTLTEQEVPAEDLFGARISLIHPARPEWAAMSAMVQEVRPDIALGEVTITFGPAPTLSAQDWVALHAAARKMQDRRINAAGAPQPDDEGSLNTGASTGNNPVAMPQIFPDSFFTFESGAMSAPWDLEEVGTAVRVRVGTILTSNDKHNSKLTCTNPTDTFTPVDGSFILVQIDELNPTEYTLVYATSWPIADDYYVETEDDGEGGRAFVRRIYPLWFFTSAIGDGSVPVLDLNATRIAPRENLAIIDANHRDDAGNYVLCPGFITAHRAG